MKFSCTQQELNKGLTIVGHAVSTRSTLPILSNILFSTEEDRIKLSATNLEIGINCWIHGKVEEAGTITVSAKHLTEFVNNLPQVDMTVSTDEETNMVTIHASKSKANIKGLEATEFPIIPGATGEETPIVLEASELKGIIAQVVFAAAIEETRPVFTGVLVQVREESLTFAAADSYRLAVRTIKLPGHTAENTDILIPARTLTELSRILPAEGTVQVIVTPNRSQVLFHTDEIDLVSRLIEGTYPQYQQIIPQNHTTRAVVNTKELTSAVKQASFLAKETNNLSKVKIQPQSSEQESGIIIEAGTENVGNAVIDITASVEGDGLDILFNIKFLADMLAIVDSPELSIEVSGATKPAVMKPLGSEEYTYVVMPMHNNR